MRRTEAKCWIELYLPNGKELVKMLELQDLVIDAAEDKLDKYYRGYYKGYDKP